MIGGTGEGVQDSAYGPSLVPELPDQVGLATTAVDHDRKCALVGQGQVAIEPVLLVGEGRVIPVTVQAGLAEGDHVGLLRQLAYAVPVAGLRLGDVIGLYPHGREDSRVPRSDLEHGGTVGGRGADGHDLDHAGSHGALDDTRQIVL